MWGYQRSSVEGAIADLVGSLVFAVAIMVVVLVIAMVVTAAIIILKELISIYIRRAGQGTETARILWIALAAFLFIVLCAALLATSPATAAVGLLLAAWSFLAFVLVAEGCNLYEQRRDPDRLKAMGNLDSPGAAAF